MGEVKQKIKESKIIPEIKKLLINDCNNQLEGTFGFQKDGTLEDVSNLPNIKENSSEYNARKKIEGFISNKTKSGISPRQAREDLIKEYSFTYINRFVALKMLEERNIIKGTVSKGFNSKEFIYYMAENPEDEELYKKGEKYKAYKRFFSYKCRILSEDEEVKLLFDPDSLVSQLFPEEITLNKIFALINQENLNDIWKEDEVIGWVYQYFIEDDKKRVFNKIYKEKKKMGLEDIASATQIFTPKWIVRYLVQNTLGRLWIRMHPDSNLREKLNYYVPNEGDKELIEIKCAKDITLLDPACGTMHFGMVAFDLFYDMYLEELKMQGKGVWPENASVDSPDDIAPAIIENNIYGIEIDFRSIQLSALSLYLKAKSKNKDASIQKYNLVCTNISNFTDEDIKIFIDDISPKYEITKKLLTLIIPELNKAYYLGSLLKIEDTINNFISKEKKFLADKFKAQLDLFATEEQMQLALSEKVTWEEVRDESLMAMEEFVSKSNGGRESYLALESKKGIGLINALIKKHSIVLTNPPFSGRRNWCNDLSLEIKNIYKEWSIDLYTCFINRCLNLTETGGLTGLISIHTFMFTSSNEVIRKHIIEKCVIETMIHLGPTFMELSNPYAQQCACYIFKKGHSKYNNGIYFRVIDYINEEKRLAFEDALGKYKNGEESNKIFILPQEKLKQIPSWPFVYWISDGIRGVFKKYKNLDYYSKSVVGLQTSNNFRFLRFWWEAEVANINFDAKDRNSTFDKLSKWFPYMKGGGVERWYGNQEYIVNYKNDGEEIINVCNAKYSHIKGYNPRWVVKNPNYYFKEGATFSFLTISNLSVRYMPAGFIFDVAGSSIFPKKTNIYLLIAILNSKVSTYLIKLLNPTVNYQAGDLARLPYPDESKNPELVNKIIKNTKKCIELKKEIVKTDELSWEFISPPNWDNGLLDILEKEKELAILESEISEAVYKLYDILPEDIKQIEDEFGRLPGDLELIEDMDDSKLKTLDELYLKKHIPKVVLNNKNTNKNGESNALENNKKGNTKGNARYLTFEEVCLASGFHPETVNGYIKKNKLEREEEKYQLSVKYISYAIGAVMGKYNINGITPDDDGIAVIDKGHTDDLTRKIEIVLSKIVGVKSTDEIIKIIGGDLRKFLNYEFFIKHHIKIYKKKPIYWLLQTSKKHYSFYIYNIKFTSDTLYSLIQKYINPRIKLEESRLVELKEKDSRISLGKEKREIGKLIDKSMEFLEELNKFKEKINEVIDSGYRPYIDDGVILNMAPLYRLTPWREPEKYFRELQEGRYEWSNISKIVKKLKY